MIYILFLAVIILACVGFFINRFDIISPFFISCVMYCISTMFVISNKENWSIQISSMTVFTIVIALIAFGIGEFLVKSSFSKRKILNINNILYERIEISKSINIIINLFSGIILCSYYFKIKSIAISMGYIEGQNLMIQYARLGILNKGISIGAILAIGTFILRGIAYIYTFIITYNRILCKKRKIYMDYIYIIPIIFYLIQYSLGGSRGGIIEYIAYVLSLIFIFRYKVSKNQVKNNIIIIKYSILALVVFFTVFTFLGSIKGWQVAEAKSTLSLYTGGSILALDKYINSPKEINYIFGKESLLGINHILYLLDIYQQDSSRALEFININSLYSTNVYTALRRYINDFGYIGMIFIQFILGYIFSFFYQIIRRKSKISYLDILYSTFFMVLVYQSIDEQFLVSILSVTQIFTIGITFILYKILLSKKVNKVIRSELNQ